MKIRMNRTQNADIQRNKTCNNKGFNVLQSICFVRLYGDGDDTDITQSQ